MRTANPYPFAVTRSDADSYADFIAGVRERMRDADALLYILAGPITNPDCHFYESPGVRDDRQSRLQRAADLATDFDLERPHR